MERSLDATVFIVDDDSGVREALAWLLRSRRLLSEAFDSADAFERVLANGFVPNSPGCVLMDVRMPGTSGLVQFDKLLARGWQRLLPVIFLTGHADVATAVAQVKRGAFDFCEKPFSDNALVDRVEQALAVSAQELAERLQQRKLGGLLAELTEREQGVMRLVVQGLPNKLIADQLGISVRTVEVHRARVFEKMNVKSAVDLANLLR